MPWSDLMVWVVALGVTAVVLSRLCGLIRHHRRQSTPIVLTPPSEPKRTYGHPWSPTEALWKKLPALPGSYQWETKVVPDLDRGYYWLHLTLVDIATGTNVATQRFNLTRHSYDTYGERYRSYPSLKRDTFNNDLIGPMVDWASTQVIKLEANEVYDYRLGKDGS